MQVKFTFKVGDKVWVRDRRLTRGGFRLVPAVVKALDNNRHFTHDNGEGYELSGNLYWYSYPKCRIFPTRAEARNTKLPKTSRFL